MFKNYAFCGKHMWTYVWKHICGSIMWTLASLVTQMVKNPSAMKEIWVRSLGWEDPLEKWIAIHSNILTWRILWTVSSMGSQRGAHDWATFTFTMQTIKSSINNDYVAIQTGEGDGTPLQYSCLENPMDGGAGRLQAVGSLRVGQDWATSLSLFTFMHWRRKWQPTPVFLPGESQGWGSLVGCHLWGHTELDTTKAT